MILDHNFFEESIDIDVLIKWLRAEKAGGAETVHIVVNANENADNSVLEDISENEESNHIATVKLEAE